MKTHMRSGTGNDAKQEVKMDTGKNLALKAVCAMICSEKKKRIKKKRKWVKEWISTRGQQGLSVLQRELEVSKTCLSTFFQSNR